MTKSTHFAALVAALALLPGCGKNEPATYVPGQAMSFPMRSDGVLKELGKPVLGDCQTLSTEAIAQCTSFIEGRIESCMPKDEPAVYDSVDHYKSFAKPYLECVTATP